MWLSQWKQEADHSFNPNHPTLGMVELVGKAYLPWLAGQPDHGRNDRQDSPSTLAACRWP